MSNLFSHIGKQNQCVIDPSTSRCVSDFCDGRRRICPTPEECLLRLWDDDKEEIHLFGAFAALPAVIVSIAAIAVLVLVGHEFLRWIA